MSETGPRGIQGRRGEQGTQGVSGEQGVAGEQGVSGEAGVAGAAGAAGPGGVSTRFQREWLAFVAIVFVALAVVGYMGYRTWVLADKTNDVAAENRRLAIQGKQARDALCVLRADLEQRADDSQAFLDNHPGGFAVIDAATIQNSIDNQRSTLKSLGLLDCVPPPKRRDKP